MSMKKTYQRRQWLKLGAVALFAPRIVYAKNPTNPDVVIIGAGIAGIEAAKTLHSKGISFVVVEANNRIGGRVYTNNDIFGIPFDTHAHWISNPTANPLIQYGKNNGFDVYRAPTESRSFVDNHQASAEEYQDLYKTYTLYNKRIEASVKNATGEDDNALSALGEDFFKLPWGYTVASNKGVWGMALNSKDYSPKDWWNSVGGVNHYCREGYGSLVAHYGRDVPVSLGTWVSEIDWSGDGVKVITSEGTIKAKATIITVSVGVLAHNRIKFKPVLPVKKQEAIDGIGMGIMNYIGLQFTDDVFGFGADVYVDQQQHDENGVGYLANMSGTNLVYSYVGGDQARALENETMDVAIAHSLDGIKSMLGNGIEEKFIKGHSTTTGKIPFWDGAYSAAKPGKQPMRAVLRQTLAEKMFFSGEACHPSQWGTVDGGLHAGKTSAENAVLYIKSNR